MTGDSRDTIDAICSNREIIFFVRFVFVSACERARRLCERAMLPNVGTHNGQMALSGASREATVTIYPNRNIVFARFVFVSCVVPFAVLYA